MLVLRTPLKHRNVNRLPPTLKFHRHASLFTRIISLHTLPLHTMVRATNMGYPCLVAPPIIRATPPSCRLSWQAIAIATNMGYPWLDLRRPLQSPSQQKDQGDDIAEGHRGVPTVGLPALDQQGNSPHSPLDIVSKESEPLLHAHDNSDHEPASALGRSPSVRCKSICELRVPGYTQTMIAMK